MKAVCKKCHYSFVSDENNCECPACGYDMRPYITGKVRITNSVLKDLLFWVVYICIIFVLINNVEFFKSDVAFPIIIIITIFVSLFKSLTKRRKGSYKEVIGERLDRKDFAEIGLTENSIVITYGIVYRFFVDGKEYRCASGNVNWLAYHLFSKKNAKIMYNVDDPRDSYEKSASFYKSFLFMAFVLIVLLILKSIL